MQYASLISLIFSGAPKITRRFIYYSNLGDEQKARETLRRAGKDRVLSDWAGSSSWETKRNKNSLL